MAFSFFKMILRNLRMKVIFCFPTAYGHLIIPRKDIFCGPRKDYVIVMFSLQFSFFVGFILSTFSFLWGVIKYFFFVLRFFSVIYFFLSFFLFSFFLSLLFLVFFYSTYLSHFVSFYHLFQFRFLILFSSMNIPSLFLFIVFFLNISSSTQRKDFLWRNNKSAKLGPPSKFLVELLCSLSDK